MDTATDKSTVQLVLIFLGVLTTLLFIGTFILLLGDKPATTVVVLSVPAGTGLGLLGATLNNTRTAAGAVAPVAALSAPPDPDVAVDPAEPAQAA